MRSYGINLAIGVLASLVIVSFLMLGAFAVSGGLGFKGRDLLHAAEHSVRPTPVAGDFM